MSGGIDDGFTNGFKHEIKVDAFGSGIIEINELDHVGNRIKSIIDTKNELTKEALVSLGWTPPTKENTVLLPESLTAENGAKDLLIGEFSEPVLFSGVSYDVMISWETIKDIYNLVVENLQAKP